MIPALNNHDSKPQFHSDHEPIVPVKLSKQAVAVAIEQIKSCPNF